MMEYNATQNTSVGQIGGEKVVLWIAYSNKKYVMSSLLSVV